MMYTMMYIMMYTMMYTMMFNDVQACLVTQDNVDTYSSTRVDVLVGTTKTSRERVMNAP